MGEVRPRVRKKVEKITLSNPLGRVLAYTRAQFSLVHSQPPKPPKWWSPAALKKLSGERLNKVFEKPVIFSRFWGTLKLIKVIECL